MDYKDPYVVIAFNFGNIRTQDIRMAQNRNIGFIPEVDDDKYLRHQKTGLYMPYNPSIIARMY